MLGVKVLTTKNGEKLHFVPDVISKRSIMSSMESLKTRGIVVQTPIPGIEKLVGPTGPKPFLRVDANGDGSQRVITGGTWLERFGDVLATNASEVKATMHYPTDPTEHVCATINTARKIPG